ncbi:hypothetical protein RchiOBHm_Chr3g0451791 [Rosa chinensis]|uniref:Uncharacterized protein n=1 Tax=Rosa chinensis TaxID=74649 RepID=A0A2P6R654_ROSCH|nr:hypothetical protein RchiOBHm_Chr3g0451791 [Rosa chinensis]
MPTTCYCPRLPLHLTCPQHYKDKVFDGSGLCIDLLCTCDVRRF